VLDYSPGQLPPQVEEPRVLLKVLALTAANREKRASTTKFIFVAGLVAGGFLLVFDY
jgi:hypothetical protein